MEKGTSHLYRIEVEVGIGSMQKWQTSIGVGHPLRSEKMVEMAVGEDVMLDGETMVLNIGFYGLLVVGKECATVNDDGFVGVVAHNVGVFVNRAIGECLYLYHDVPSDEVVANLRVFAVFCK